MERKKKKTKKCYSLNETVSKNIHLGIASSKEMASEEASTVQQQGLEIAAQAGNKIHNNFTGYFTWGGQKKIKNR